MEMRTFSGTLPFDSPVKFYMLKAEWMIMMKKNTWICLIVLLGIFLLVFPAMAALNTISQGNTVFLGEEGLDISGAMNADTQIGWWASGASVATSAPYPTYVISNAKNFYADPSLFGSYQGAWYRLDALGKADGTAFVIADPSLNLRVEDTSVSVDVTQNKWVYRGDEVGFRIETNLNAIASQRNTPALITIKVQSPDGGVYSALVDKGVTTPIENIPVSTSPYDTNSIWDTGGSSYPSGTYTIWAECNVNNMKNNYETTGKTVSTHISMLNTEFNPLIGVNVPTTNPTTQVASTHTTVITTTPTPKITTIPKTSPTTVVITATPTAVATSIMETSATTPPAPVATTPKKSPGFGILVTVVSVALITALALKKH